MQCLLCDLRVYMVSVVQKFVLSLTSKNTIPKVLSDFITNLPTIKFLLKIISSNIKKYSSVEIQTSSCKMFQIFVLCSLLTFTFSAKLSGSPNIDKEWEGRIVGGSTAAAGQFPHMASLRTTGNTHFCGGFIINNRWIGSAAHVSIIMEFYPKFFLQKSSKI